MVKVRAVPDRVWILAIILISFSLRVYRLGDRSLWFDEAISGLAAHFDLATILAQRLDPMAPPLYFVLLSIWGRVLTGIGILEPEAVLRSMSTMFSIVALLPIYILGRRMFSSRVGLMAALLMAILPLQIYYAQEARAYGLEIFISAVILLLFVRSVSADRIRDWCGYAAVCVLGVYVHYMIGLLIISFHGFALAHPHRQRLVRRLLLVDLSLVVCMLPLAGDIVQQSGQLSQAFTLARPNLLAPLLTLAFLFWGYVTTTDLFLPLALFSVLALFGIRLISTIQTRRSASTEIQLLLFVIFLPMLIMLSLSFLIRPIYFDRYFAFATPALVIWVAQGIELRPNGVYKLFIGLVVVLSVIKLTSYFSTFDPAKPPFREASAFIADRSQPDDIVFHLHDSTFVSFRYYAPNVDAILWQDDAAGWLVPSAWKWYGQRTSDVSSLFNGHARIWVMSLPDTLDQTRRNLETQIASRYPRVLVERFENLEVSLYVAPSGDVNDGP